MRRQASILGRFSTCARGVTAMEFAIIAPVMILMLFGIIEFAMIMLVNNVLESATAISSRLGSTGYAAAGTSREDTIKQSISDHAGMLIDVSKVSITSKYYSQFDQIGDPEPWNDLNHNGQVDPGEWTDVNGNGVYDTDMGTAGYGGANDIVVYTVSYPWSIATPLMSALIGTNGIFTITTHAVVKNEPY